MAHIHDLYDDDRHFLVNKDTREISLDGGGEILLVQYDHNSERLTFRVPRYADGYDLSLCNIVQVHYVNVANNRTQNRGVCEISEFYISTEDENVLIVSWLISQNVTQYKGNLSFLLRFICTTGGDVDYAWNTQVYSDVLVVEGMYNGEVIPPDFTDIIEQWREEVLGGESIQKAVAEYFEKNPPAGGGSEERGPAIYRAPNKKWVYWSSETFAFSDLQIPGGCVPKTDDLVLMANNYICWVYEVNEAAETVILASFSPPVNLNGKTAYEYAQDAGYTGTEEEFAEKMNQEVPEGAVLYTEQELTDEQKTQARANIGVSDKKIVSMYDYGTHQVDYTSEQIKELVDNGHVVILRYQMEENGKVSPFEEYHLIEWSRNTARFNGEVYFNHNTVMVNWATIDRYGVVEYTRGNRIAVPSSTSELENDSEFVTLPDVKRTIVAALDDYASNNQMLKVQNTSGWLSKTVSIGASVPLDFNWSSIEGEIPTGPGVAKIYVNDTLKFTGQIEQGDITLDVGSYLVAGNNTVKLNITDTYGNSRDVVYTITAIEVSLSSKFDNTVPYTGAFSYIYTPVGMAPKTVHFRLDGEELSTETVTTSGRQQSKTIPAQKHGSHILEVWFVADIDGDSVPSNTLRYDIICLEEGNAEPVVATNMTEATVEQGENVVILYRVYNPTSLTTAVVLSGPDLIEPIRLTVDRTEQSWAYRADTVGSQRLRIICGSLDRPVGGKPIELTVTPSSMKVEAETENLSLYLTSYGRSNNEENPAVWNYGDVAANLTGFNFKSDGWLQDGDGITVLRVGGDARVEIPVLLFGQDFRSTGKTIEIEFASRSVLDYDAVIATCWAGGRGLEITAQQAVLSSEKTTVFTRYKEDDHLRLSFVIEKRSGNRLIIAYINGIISGMLQYPDGDDFSQMVPVSITLGSNDCTLDVYNIRVYDSDLTRFQVLDNWIADTRTLGEKKDRYDRNRIFDDYDRILPSTLSSHQCYLVLDCPVLPTYKGDKKTCSGRYVDPVKPDRSFTFTGAEIDVQGTSSQFYYVKNFKIKFKGGFVQNGETVNTYAMNDNAVPTNEFTFKADVASSEGANNVVLAELYNDLCPVKTPAQEEDPRVRQTIEGHPIVVFHDDGSGAKFVGKYNFNNDKGTPEVFGFARGDESWEIRENGNAQVSFKTDDFTDWENSFEARYPDKYKDISRFQQFVSWVASTNTEGQTEEEKTRRLAKFKTELADWANVEDAIFYYLFTLVFLCIDQREKNAFPTWIAEMQQWLWLFYDADSSLGTDNKGNLTFEYWMEDIDYTEAGDPVFNGQNNVFWSNLRECFADEIRDEYRRLRTELASDGKPLLSYERVNDLFTAHQSQWSEAIYNEDAWHKAVEPLEKIGDDQYLSMQQGKKEQHFKHFLYNRFRYLDSKFETGAALDDENRIMMRAHAQGNIWLTSYINMYGQVYYNSQVAERRMFRDQAYEFEWKAEGGEDAVIGVNSAPMITSLGDLSPLMLEYCHIQYAKHLTELKVGAGGGYVNNNLVALTLGNNTLLRKLDVRGCASLTQAVDASGCTNIEEVYFDGTAIVGLSLPNGGILKKLHLPETITDLTLLNQTKLTEFVLPGYENITTLRLENVNEVVPVWDIFGAIPVNSRVRLVGVGGTISDEHLTVTLKDRLDAMRGLDENGNNLDRVQISGAVKMPFLSNEDLVALEESYPDLKIIRNSSILGVAIIGDMLLGEE